MMGKESIHFFMEKQYFIPLYVMTEIWQKAGYDAIIYISALAGIDMGAL